MKTKNVITFNDSVVVNVKPRRGVRLSGIVRLRTDGYKIYCGDVLVRDTRRACEAGRGLEERTREERRQTCTLSKPAGGRRPPACPARRHPGGV